MSGPPSSTRWRDIIVIGTSAGGVEAIPRLLVQLPAQLPAALFIVQHLSPTHNPYLVDILKRDSPLPVSWAEQGEPIERGRVYVAPPDAHLLFADEHLQLSRAARENHARPSIDRLFRSAATQHGGRVIGVLLTGMLCDGVAGLRAIREAGGVVIVQDPRDAAFPDLPSRALLALDPDHTLPLDGIATALTALAGTVAGTSTIPEALAMEATLDRIQNIPLNPEAMNRLGRQTPVACPQCNGPTWLLGDEHTRRYRCYLGHANGVREMMADKTEQIETALWSAVRALSERACTLETLADDAERLGCNQSAESYRARAKEAREQAGVARQFMVDLTRPV